MSRWLILICSIFLAGSSAVTAATLKSSQLKDGRVVILISGELVEGDTEAFKSAVKTANDAGKLVLSIRLNSPGGSLLEGVKLADAVRFGKIVTNVGQGATCASACFLVFAAGSMKYANYSARVGVHGASDQSGQETAGSGAATVSMARVAKELGVPAAIIGKMVVTPPAEMVWLSPADLESMGVSLVGKPSQVAQPDQPAQQTQTAVPVDITPKAKATVGSPTWKDFVDAAIVISAKQNNGSPRYVRGCQPELKACYDVVIYRDKDGIETAVKVVKDMKDKIVLREVCTFNATSDIRRCFDWDSEAVHRDMKDTSGNWSKIADD
ncbi:ATP-dependent Clp protease proteolytic subunit [Bradyrhizobium guangdongense]